MLRSGIRNFTDLRGRSRPKTRKFNVSNTETIISTKKDYRFTNPLNNNALSIIILQNVTNCEVQQIVLRKCLSQIRMWYIFIPQMWRHICEVTICDDLWDQSCDADARITLDRTDNAIRCRSKRFIHVTGFQKCVQSCKTQSANCSGRRSKSDEMIPQIITYVIYCAAINSHQHAAGTIKSSLRMVVREAGAVLVGAEHIIDETLNNLHFSSFFTIVCKFA